MEELFGMAVLNSCVIVYVNSKPTLSFCQRVLQVQSFPLQEVVYILLLYICTCFAYLNAYLNKWQLEDVLD